MNSKLDQELCDFFIDHFPMKGPVISNYRYCVTLLAFLNFSFFTSKMGMIMLSFTNDTQLPSAYCNNTSDIAFSLPADAQGKIGLRIRRSQNGFLVCLFFLANSVKNPSVTQTCLQNPDQIMALNKTGRRWKKG